MAISSSAVAFASGGSDGAPSSAGHHASVPDAQALLFHSQNPVVVNIEGEEHPRLARLPYAAAMAAAGAHVAEGDATSADFLVLGTRAGEEAGDAAAGALTPPPTAVVAVDVATGVSAVEDGDALVAALNSSAALTAAAEAAAGAAPGSASFAVGHPRALLLLPSGTLSAEDLSDFATARGVLMWHASHRFSGVDGSPTVIREGGAKRVSAGGHGVYPRVDPVAIMVVTHPSRPAILLARQAGFPRGFYSALAGFVEAGETLEAAVAREAGEEAGVVIDPRAVRYVASQPWPLARTGAFSQLMLGALAPAASEELAVDTAELQHACWVELPVVRKLVAAAREAASKGAGPRRPREGGSAKPARAEPPALVQGEPPQGRMFIPGPYAVAFHLIEAWVQEQDAAQEAHL